MSGPGGQPVSTVRSVDGDSLTLDGANAAKAVTDFGTGGAVRVRLISQIPGESGRGINVVVERRNFGGVTNPVVVVSDQTIRVQLNNYTPAGQDLSSTAQDFVNAINNNPQASRLLRATIQEGDATTRIGSLSAGYSPITLGGVSDIAVEPGFVGLGDSSREVIFRFAEPLPDDIYQIDILGSGTLALRGDDGEAFQDGTDLTRRFSINLGPQVVAVVPEPVRRQSDGSLGVETGIIEVHFNDDDLDPALAENPDYYQLIFTRETASNTDDVTIALDADGVEYSSVTNIARLNYKRSLARIADPANPGELLSGAVRLRVGSSAPLPMEPQELPLPAATAAAPDGAGDSFETAFDLTSGWTISSNTTSSAYLNTEILNEQHFGLQLPGPDVPGTRDIRPEDPSRLSRVVPLDYVRQFADQVDGISVIEYDFVASWLGDDPNRPGITEDFNYFNIISEQQKQRVREVMTLYSEYLGVTFVEVTDRDPADIAGFSIAVGNLYGGDERGDSAEGGLAVVTRDRDLDGVDDLVVLDFQDFDESDDDQFGGEFFRGAMFGVGQLLGYGYADDLPQPVTQSTSFIFTDDPPGSVREHRVYLGGIVDESELCHRRLERAGPLPGLRAARRDRADPELTVRCDREHAAPTRQRGEGIDARMRCREPDRLGEQPLCAVLRRGWLRGLLVVVVLLDGNHEIESVEPLEGEVGPRERPVDQIEVREQQRLDVEQRRIDVLLEHECGTWGRLQVSHAHLAWSAPGENLAIP